ncbi:ABC transporter ATPase and permease [Corynebacterium deserti GIMN1.010]|uniref:ABC transporter ATPase and permease n=1 Tax=Corynebacterium deserti GIMN1.010 TaxID=931089 RepID=A0A0M5IJ59_9CORY|nr:ABC transporter ATP-binding protein [Corynebacterium deserti]ALC06261.1 ABC transporter ATPase and permease [Corynebacterium deserti GIMN1.010]
MIRKLLYLARPIAKDLALSTALRLINQLCALAALVFPAWVLTITPTLSLWTISAVMAGLVLIAALCRWGEQVCGHRAAFGLLASMRIRLYDALVRRGATTSAHGSGSIMAVATRDINSIEVFFAHTIAPAITAILITAGSLIALWIIHPTALLFGLCGFAVAWLIPLLKVKKLPYGEATSRGRITQHLAEDVAGRGEIRSHGAESARMDQLRIKEHDLIQTVTAQQLNVGIRQSSNLIWPLISAALIIAFVPSSPLVAAALVLAAAPAIEAIEGFARTMPTALNSARNYFEIIDADVEIAEPSHPVALPNGPLGVGVHNVALGRGTTKLGTVNFDIPAGSHVGLVGASGSGKSTLASFVLRLADPVSGYITVGGINVTDVSLTELRTAIGLVEQRAVLFRGSVLENLRVGNPDLSEDGAREALKKASISEISLTTDALSLSGGQQQRVCVARALARNPRVLIVDEATSHQDALNQAELSATFARLEGVTVIIIAHRAASLNYVDYVIDLEAEKIP